MMKNGIKTEVCCASLADCKMAERCGADAIELVSAHLLGGLTPTIGLLRRVKEQVKLPVSVIVRPRAAGFFYSDEDFDVMCADADEFVKSGADGIVFGFLAADGSIDYERCARFMKHTAGCETVFHRAIDVTGDMCKTAKQLIELGVTRILTSGGCESAIDGAGAIKELVDCYGGKIQILAGGGVRAENVAELIEKTGVRRVHFGCTAYERDISTGLNPKLNFGTSALPPNECYIAVNEEKLRQMLLNI
ncbi:MAG: copper homeostasis protein CutC [Hydrogenoanaerobacterium sp.]